MSNTIHIGIQCGGFQYKSATLLGILDTNDATWIQDLIAVNEIGSSSRSSSRHTVYTCDHIFKCAKYLLVVVVVVCVCVVVFVVVVYERCLRVGVFGASPVLSFRIGLLTEY